MTDREATISELKRWVLEFSRERDWEQFHHPKDLGIALACEVGEVLEHFRFRGRDQVRADLDDPDRRGALGHELADVLWSLLRLADVCEVDLASALREKLELAGRKYPINQSFGRADKYTAYPPPGPEADRPG